MKPLILTLAQILLRFVGTAPIIENCTDIIGCLLAQTTGVGAREGGTFADDKISANLVE